MLNPDLGILKPDPRFEGCLQGSTVFLGHKIELRVDPDGTDITNCIALAEELVKSLSLLDTKARLVAADKLLENYNDNWRMFQRVRADRTAEEIINPALSADEFSLRLKLKEILVTGEMIEFHFGDDDMFAGHSVFVSSFDGIAFTNTDASLFG